MKISLKGSFKDNIVDLIMSHSVFGKKVQTKNFRFLLFEY
jgi:hypothetical protein